MITTTPDASRVRVATRDDAPALLAIARSYHDEHDDGPFSEEKTVDLLRRAFTPNANDPVLIGVAGEARVEGACCIVVDSPNLGESPFLEILWCHVLADYRKNSAHARDLIAFARQWAAPPPIGIGLPLRMKVRVTHKTEGQARMLRRLFGEPQVQEWVIDQQTGGV